MIECDNSLFFPMHIPGNMLAGHVVPVTNSLSAVAVAGVTYYAVKSKNKPAVLRFAGVAALIFALQMINFPIQSGTSGHLIGAVLAVFLLGAPFGILAMMLVLVVQSLVFADGGVTALGANILNMAIVGGLIGAGARFLVKDTGDLNRNVKTGAKSFLVLSAGAWISVILGALICSLELAISGVVDFNKVAMAMLGTHVLIGAGEAVISVLVFVIVGSHKIVASKKMAGLFPLGLAGVVAFLLSPFASALPDGLESVAEQLGFMPVNMPTFVSPLAGYTFPMIGSDMLATALAGLAGVILIFAFAGIVGKVINPNLKGV